MELLDFILDLVREYGGLYYAIVFAWTFLEGENFVIFSGVAARQGALDLPTLGACAWAGGFLGDQLYFAVGRRWGRSLLGRFPRLAPGVGRVLGLVRRHSTAFALTFRFAYGVRNVSSFACGMSDIPWIRFAALNFLGAGIWAVAFAGGGYLAGAAFQHLVGDAARGVGLAMLALFAAAIACLLLRGRRIPAVGPAD